MSEPTATFPIMNRYPPIAGEPAFVIAQAFVAVTDGLIPLGDGSFDLQAQMPLDVAISLMRAIARVEAELLIAEADVIGASLTTPRTRIERRWEAIFELRRRLGEVASASG